MATIDLQDLITEKNVELQEFIKEQMRIHQLSNLSIDQRELMIDTPAISTKQMIDTYYSTIQYVAARLIELEGNNEAWNKHRAIIMKKVAKKEKEKVTMFCTNPYAGRCVVPDIGSLRCEAVFRHACI